MEIDYSAWKIFSEGKTPGTTPLPEKFSEYLNPSSDKLVVDVGCGWGRVSVWLYLQGYSVVGTDINDKEIERARVAAKRIIKPGAKNTLNFQVDDSSKHIELGNGVADGVAVNGMFLAMTTPESRIGLASEILRILKPGGILSVAEFAQTSDEEYKIDYRKHALITNEYGTVVGFKKDLGITFKDKSDEEIKALGKPENIDYFSHHYTEDELREILSNFEILELNKEKFTTRSGKHINGFVIYAKKP